jgi:hypothetical protein
MPRANPERTAAPMTTPTTAGYSVTVLRGRIFLVDQHPDRGDCRISPQEARELAQRLLHAAAAIERDPTAMAEPAYRR